VVGGQQTRRAGAALFGWSALALVPVLLQALALLNPDVVIVDCEERYNAAHAWTLLSGHADALFRLQYRAFCGGCTLTAALGAVSMGLAGPSFLAWKGVALVFSLALSLGGTLGLHRREGPVAAGLFVALLALSPWSWIQLQLLSWGNHTECAVLGVGMVLLLAGRRTPRRLVLAGLLGGVGLWVGFTMAVFVLPALVVVARGGSRDLMALGMGLLAAPALWAIQVMAGGPVPFGTIYSAGEVTPQLSRVPGALWSIVAPEQLAGLFGLPRLSLGVPLGLTAGAALLAGVVLGWRQGGVARLGAGVMLCWLGAYLVLGFPLYQPGSGMVPSAPGLRYFAPVYALAPVVLAAVSARLWSARRGWALALVGPALLTGLAARVATFSGPALGLSALHFEAADWDYFRNQASYMLRPAEHRSCPATDPRDRDVHAYALGRLAVQQSVSDGRPLPAEAPSGWPAERWHEGVGGGLIDLRDGGGTSRLEVLVEVAEELEVLGSSGQASALGEATWRRVRPRSDEAFGAGPASSRALQRQLAGLDGVAPALVEAWLSAAGRRWGRFHGRWGSPTQVPFPSLSGSTLGPFAEGLGEGLGEEWGPRGDVPLPAGLPVDLEEALRRGYLAGIQRTWTGGPTEAPNLGGPAAGHVETDRWWGPPPGRLCPCGATCE